MRASNGTAGTKQSLGRWVALVMVGALVIAGCSSSSSDGDSSTDDAEADATSGEDATDADRPEGTWTSIRWTSSRSDDEAGTNKGLARISQWDVMPECDAGPCDFTIEPAGTDGTYLPEGVPVLDDPNATADPDTYSWSDEEQSYTNVDGPRSTSCTNAEAEVIADGYEFTRTTTLTYAPAEGDRAASLQGDWQETVTSTPEGEAVGCTPFESEGEIVASPTGALEEGGTIDIAGTYTTTEIVGEMTPEQRLPEGQEGLLGPMTVAGSDDSYTITGLLGAEAALTMDDEGWSGETDEVSDGCLLADDTEVPDASGTTQSWAGLQLVAQTADGKPILAGRWSSTGTPTAAGEAAGCAAFSNEGFVILVPTVSIG